MRCVSTSLMVIISWELQIMLCYVLLHMLYIFECWSCKSFSLYQLQLELAVNMTLERTEIIMSTNRMDKKQIGNHERKDSIPSNFNIKKIMIEWLLNISYILTFTLF